MANKNKFNTSIPANRKTRLNTKSNSWLSNAAKSLGYSSLDVLSEILPNTINMSKNALETSQDLINDFKDFKTVKSRLSQTMENNVYLDLMKEWKSNAVDDLKTGKFYNKERQDEAFNEDFDFDMDFDVGDDSDFDSSMSSKDGSTSVSMTRKSGDTQEVDMITVNTNINGDNPMVGAVQNQTKLAIQSSSASMELSKRNQLMTIQALQQMGQNVGGLLTSINSNVISISKDTTEMLSRHLSISSKYYDDSMKLFTDIHKELQDMNSKTKLSGDANNPNVKVREYQDVLDIFSGGSVDFKAYMGLVKKQWETTSDSNLFLSAFKNIASQTDVLGMMAKNPLKFIADSAIKKVIPGMVKQAAGDFDNTLGEAIVSKLHQVSNLQNSNNPLLEIIGKVFGISNKKISYDKTQYEKGKVDWNGISHRTLNDVIPFYLRKILSAVSGGQEIGFDYNRGEYKLVNDLVKDQKQDMESRLLSPLSGMIGEFKDFLGQMKFSTDGERTEVEDSFKKLSLDLVKSDGGKNFRRVYDKKTNTYRDDIASSLNKSSDDAIVQLIRGFFQGSKNSDVMRFFNSDVLSAKAGYSKLMNDMMLNPMQYNAHYMDLGVGEADKFLKFDKRTGRKVIGKKKGGTGFGSDNYNKTPTDYLRSILDTLNRGLKVAVVNYNDITGEHTSSRRKRGTITGYSTMYNDIVAKSQGKLDKLKEDSDDYSKIKYKDKRDRTGKVLSREEIDKYRLKGKHVVSLTDDDTNETIAKSVREDQIRRDYEKEQETTLSKVGALAPSSSLNKLIYKFSTYIDKPGQVMKDFFNKADDFVFKLVFGEDKTDSNNSLLARSFEYMEKTFSKFSLWLDEKVLEPLNESLFGDNGLITNLKNSKMFNDMKGYMSNIRDSLLGTKNKDNIREGGLLSGLSNEFKATFGLVKQAILGGKVKDAHGNWIEQTSPSVLDHVKTIGKNVGSTLGEMFGIQMDPSKQSSSNAFIDGLDNVWNTVKNRTSLVLDDILGPASDDPTSKRNRVNLFMKETKDSLPKTLAYGTIGAGASLGLGFLGSWFLPGGPIGGALLGAGLGLVSGSESLKTTLFGDLIDDGKGGKERAGAIINKQTQDFFKKHGKGSLLGAGLGAMATSQLGFLGGMFTPLGPIGGALLGSGISLATKTDAFQEFLWGTEDKDGNTIKRGILGSLKNKANKGSFSDKFIDAGIGAGVGLMGSFFLPGGPVMGAMLGAIGNLTLNSEGAKTFLFGDKNEKGERVGGVVGSVKSWMSDNMGKPMAKTFEKAQIEVGHFIRNNMVLPFTKALDPLKEEFFRVQERMATGFKNVMESFKDNANKSFEKFFGKPLGDFMRDNVLNPIKGILGKIFGGIGKVVGTIAASPFKLLNTVADGLFQKHQKEGKQAFIEDGVQNLIGKSAKEKRKQDGVTRKAFSTYDYDGNKIGGGFLGDLGQLLSRKNYKEAANSEKGAVYNKDNKWVEANRLREKEERDRYQKELLDYEYKWQNDGEKQHKTPYQMQLEKEKKSTTQTTTTKPNQTKVSEADSAIAESVDSNGNKVRFVSDKFSTLKEYYNRASSGTRLKLGKSKDSIVSGNKVLSNKVVSGNLTKPTIKDNQTKLSTEVDDRIQAVSEMDKKINKAKVVSTKLSQSQRDSLLKNIEGYTKVIATEVRGQLDGLGSNVYKLRKIVQTKLGVDDEDVKGSGNRDRLGFFGKLKRGIKNPIEFMKDLTMKPIDGLVNLYHKGLDKLTSLFKLPKKIIGSVFKGLEVLGKGIWDVTTSLLKVPEFLAKSLYEVLKVVGPVVKEAFVNTIKFAGTALVKGTEFVGTMLTKTVSTVGGVLVGAAKGIGSTIGTILKTTASVIGGGLVVAKDAIVEGSKLLIQGAGMVGKALMTTISAPFKLAGKVLGWGADKLTDKSKLIQRVQVIGGKLDEVKVIREIKGSSDSNPSTKPNSTKLSTDDDGKIGSNKVSKTTDNMNTALTIQAEKATEEKYQAEIKANRKDYNYFASKDADQDKAIEDEKKRSTLFGKLSELTNTTKQHASNWAEMFGKKSLIGMGLMIGIPLLTSFLKDFSWTKLSSAIMDGVAGLGGIISDAIKGIFNKDEEQRTTSTGGVIENDLLNQTVISSTGKVINKGISKSFDILDSSKKFIGKGIKSVGTMVSNTKDAFKVMTASTSELAAMKADKDLYKYLGKSSSEASKKAIATNTTKITSSMNSTMTNITTSVKKESTELVAKFIDMMKKPVYAILEQDVVIKLLNKTGVTKVISKMDEVFKKLAIGLTENFAKFSGRMSLAVAEDGAAFIPIVGQLMKGAFLLYDGVTGYMEASEIFGLHPDDVTLGMRAVAAIAKCVVGLSAVLDLGSEFMKILTGFDLRSTFALIIYEVACSVGSTLNLVSDEGLESLAQSRAKTKKAFDDYNETQKTHGGNEISFAAYLDALNASKKDVKKDNKNKATGKNYVGYDYIQTQYNESSTSTTGKSYTIPPKSYMASTKTLYNKPSYTSNKVDTPIRINNGGLGGFGGDDEFTYYSQNDPRYANNPYYTSGEQSDGGVPQTIGKRGCGPTSLAMVASELTGQQIDPVTLSNVATNEGYSTTMGTHPDYFRNIGSKFGLNVNETSTSEGAIKSSLASGQPVILQGVSQGEDNSAFTPAGHYVVATKTDGDNVMVNDPRGKRYSKAYNINQLVNESAKMWSFGTTGMGPTFDYSGTSIKTQNPLYNMYNSTGTMGNPFIESRPVMQDISVGPGPIGPSVGQSVVDIANQFIGRPYIWGAEGSPDWNNDGEASDGFDCSGLVSHALNFAGVKNYGRLTASDFFRKATPVNKSSLIPGDLGFVSSGGSITHVGIYAGNDEWIEAMGSAEQVVRVPSNRASKWTSYGRLKEVNDLANIDSSYLNYGQTSVSYAEENKPTSFFGGILDIVSNNVNKFFGFNSESSSSPNVGNIYPMYGDGQLSSTQASSLRDAVNKKTRELLVQSESGGNYAIAKNDKSSATGNSISPSIGVLQWRGSYADQLMSRMSQALPNDPEAKYFDSINWSTEANKGPWSSNQLDRYKNFMTRNANISKSVQDKYAEEYIDDRLTSNLFKHMVDPGLIKDPRSMVLLNDISQTGPAHIGTFASNYDRTIPSGLNEFNHVFNEVTSDKSYWGRHMSTYKNRFNKNKESLQNWQVSLPGYSNPIKTQKSQAKLDKMNSYGGPTVMGMGGLLSKAPKRPKSHNTPILMGMGGLDKYNKKPKYTKTSRVDKTYSRESSNVKIKDTIQQGFGAVADERIIKLLTTMVDYLKDTKDGIKEFNDKDFNNNNKSVIQYVDSSNNVVSNNSNTVNGKKTTKKVDNKTDNRSYNKAKAIAGGLII